MAQIYRFRPYNRPIELAMPVISLCLNRELENDDDDDDDGKKVAPAA